MPQQNDLEELKRHPSVLRLFMQRIKLTRQGNRFRGSCPFHDEKTPSLDVYQQNGVYLFGCFGCGAKGNVIQFVEKKDGISFAAAVKLVREFVTGSPEHEAKVVDEVFKPIGEAKPKKVLSLEDIKRYESALEKNQSTRDWLLNERGIDYETAKRLHTGYVQDIGKLIGSSDQEVRDKGWLVFPCTESGQVLSIKFRSIAKKCFRRMTGMKSDVLYNLDTIDVLEPVVLVEGEVDTLTMEMSGFRSVSLPNATTRVTPEMKDQLLSAELVILAGDNDGAAGTEKMAKLKAELGDRAVLITWPFGWKDANEVFLKECKRDVAKFRELVNGLVGTAKSMVMPGIFSLQESMRSHRQTDLANHPDRFRFCWPSVDQMAVVLPGDMVAVLATSTKLGKTAFVTQATLEAAIKHNEVVINYQAELEISRFTTNVAACVLKKDRNHLTAEDIDEAARRLGNIRYYVGSNPSLNTIGPVLDLIEAAIRRLGATVVVIDHIHFLCRHERDEIKAQADASQRICNLAKRYRCKIFMIEQPRKANQQNRGKRLHVSDGKGSESLHSDAAAIFAIHRDLVKVIDPPPMDPYSPITQVHLLGGARSKGDGASEARLVFLGKFACFSEMAHDPNNQEQGEIAWKPDN